MKIIKNVLRAGVVFTVCGWILPAASAQVAPGAAGAVSQTVFERALNHETLTAHFDVNREFGRAWIDVMVEPSDYPSREPIVVRRKIDGLSYDSTRKAVIYQNGKQKIVCAKDSSFLGMTSLNATGQCILRTSSETRRVDDGFTPKEEQVGKVVFEAKNTKQTASQP
jgi:hypothetical protein